MVKKKRKSTPAIVSTLYGAYKKISSPNGKEKMKGVIYIKYHGGNESVGRKKLLLTQAHQLEMELNRSIERHILLLRDN